MQSDFPDGCWVLPKDIWQNGSGKWMIAQDDTECGKRWSQGEQLEVNYRNVTRHEEDLGQSCGRDKRE